MDLLTARAVYMMYVHGLSTLQHLGPRPALMTEAKDIV